MRLEVIDSPNVSAPILQENTDTNSVSQAAQEALNMGIRHAQSGDRVNARIALLRATELDVRCENAWLWLASISEYPEELMAFLNNVLEINPENERAIQWMSATKSLLAKTFLQRGSDAAEADQPMYAEDCYRKALEYDRNCADAWMALASLSKDKVERVAYLDRVLSIDPERADAKVALNNLRAEEEQSEFAEIKKAVFDGDPLGALATLENFNERYPENTEAWMMRSHLAVKPVEKIEALERLLAIDPSNEAAQLSLGSLRSMFAAPPTVEEQVESPVKTDLADEQGDLSPIAPPQEALVFEPVESDLEIPATLVVDANESEQLRQEAKKAMEVADWNRETQAYDLSEFESETSVDSEKVEADMVDAFDTASAIPMPVDEVLSVGVLEPERTGFETTVQKPVSTAKKTQICPFCSTANDDIAFACSSCCAVLSLSELELVLANNNADKYVIRKAVERLEKERKGRALEIAELVTLGIGHLNLRNLQFGFENLQEASRLDPDNIVLAGQVNALHIRIDEIRRQDEAHAALTKGKTILVVDDSATVRKLIAGKLEKFGHNVICSSDGEDALQQIKTTVPDLVLLDIAMPGMDGYQVCRQIRGWVSTANTPVVMISGKDGFFDKMRGRMAGAAGHITKPFGPETLMKAVEFYLGGGTDIETEQPPIESESVN
jgi:twitching motility two-component system response regulator PilG